MVPTLGPLQHRPRARERPLGGAVVRVGSTIYDGSVKGQLEKIKEAISS